MQPLTDGLKYRVLWLIGAWACALVYFSGLYWLYQVVRKKFLQNYRAVVIMYHRVGDHGTDPALTVSCKNFEKQMRYLEKACRVVSVGHIVNPPENQPGVKDDVIGVTFDDGYKDNYLCAFPILKKYSIPATIFLVSRYVCQRPDMLTEPEMKTMERHHIAFGSHTCNHKILASLDSQAAEREILESKVELEKLLGREICFFAYPKGKREHFSKDNKQQVAAAGYTAAFTTENGEITGTDDPFALQRIGMRDYPLFVFKVRLCGIFESRPLCLLRKFLGAA